MNTKKCTTCNTLYPATTDYFRKDYRTNIGLVSRCKKCESLYFKELRSSDEFKKHEKETHAEWYKNNKEKSRANSEKYAQNHKDKINEYSRKSYAKNIEKNRARVKDWKQRNPEMAKEHVRRRRARKHSAEGSHSAKDIINQLHKQSNRCFYCDKELTDYHADHVIPLSKGGSDYIENIVITCPTCNHRKSSKLLNEWKR
jgi:5-methylcytosine-specific restriction endonuclease McrA